MVTSFWINNVKDHIKTPLRFKDASQRGTTLIATMSSFPLKLDNAESAITTGSIVDHRVIMLAVKA